MVPMPISRLSMALALTAVCAHVGGAQNVNHAIRGVVFDSVAGKPLGGATVQIAAQGSTAAPWTQTADTSGRYKIDGLPAGRYIVGFYHDALTMLGLDAPSTGVELAADTLVTVDLAIPSSRAIRTLRCGESAFESSSGMMVGSVRDAAQRSAVPDAKLQLAWRAFALDAGNYRTVTERASATIENDGSYLACHLPIDAALDLQVTGPGHRTVVGSVARVPANGIGRLDVALVDSTLDRGSAIIRGRVTRTSGSPVASGRAVIAALRREAPMQDGMFVLSDLPTGSWVVESRVIGSEPQAMLVYANDSEAITAAIAVSDQAQHLDAVTVVGKKDANAQVLDDVLRRKRIGMGTVFLPGSPALTSAIFTSDVMREARGFLYQGRNNIAGRVTGGGRRCRNIAVYVDDILQPDGFEGMDTSAPPSDVLAVETWPDILLAPVQYRSGKFVLGTRNAYCAVVLVWTKNRLRG